jgi:alpha-galactosidase
MDMLIIGNGCITHDEEMTQMALWSILASPLIMGNDLRKVRLRGYINPLD